MSRHLAVAIGALLATTLAHAEATTALPADRLVPAIGPGLVSVELAATPPPREIWWMASFGWAHQPLRLGIAGSSVRIDPVRDVTTLNLGASFGIWRGLALEGLWPIVLFQTGDRLRGTGLDETPLGSTVAGDLVLRLRAAFVGDARQPGLHLGGSLELTVPMNGRDHFAGRARPTFAVRLHGDFRHRRFGVAAQLSYRIASERAFFDRTIGDELGWGLGGVVLLWHGATIRASAVAELAGAVGGGRGARPAELTVALRLSVGAVMLDLGGGGALNDEPMAAKGRLFLTVRARSGGTLQSAW